MMHTMHFSSRTFFFSLSLSLFFFIIIIQPTSRVSREECLLNYRSYPLINARCTTIVPSFDVSMITYTRRVDSFPYVNDDDLPPSPINKHWQKLDKLNAFMSAYEVLFFFSLFFFLTFDTWNRERNETNEKE